MSEHLCITCPVRGRKPITYEHANVCNPCRGWLAWLPAEIERLWSRLGEHLTVEADGPWKVRQLHNGHWVRQPGHDPVNAELPTTARGAQPYGPRVSGTVEAPIPVNLDLVDLAALPNGLSLTAEGKRWWMDQDGHLSVAMVLDLIAREWAEALGHRLPPPTVPALAGWLTHRVEWACDSYPGVDADANELSALRGVLRAVLGEADARPERMGAPCPSCDLKTLFRHPGESKVECVDPDCRRVLTAEEYDRWSKLLAADVRERMTACPTTTT